MLFEIPVIRKSVATKTLEVEADTFEEALDKALAQAPDEDWAGCTQDYEYDVDRTPPTTCVFCGQPMPGNMDKVVDEGWSPDFWDEDEHCDGPVCNDCTMKYLGMDQSGELVLKRLDGEFVSRWDSGVESKSPCKVNVRTRDVEVQEVRDTPTVGVLEEKYVLLEGKKYQAEPQEHRSAFSPKEQAGIFFWRQ